MRLTLHFVIFSFLLTPDLQAQTRHGFSERVNTSPHLSYDLGASAGSYGGSSYSEINLGLNWYLAPPWLNWRNSLFSRFDQVESASGLDTSLRFEYRNFGDEVGLMAFAGPGARFSSSNLSGVFGEGGVILKLAGLHLGLGAKLMNYSNPGKDVNHNTLPKTDVSYFVILGGGGVL